MCLLNLERLQPTTYSEGNSIASTIDIPYVDYIDPSKVFSEHVEKIRGGSSII